MPGLTDKAIRSAKLGEKLSGKIGGGLPGRLVLRVRPSGKEFSFRYRLHGQDRMIAIGPFSPNGEAGTLTLARAHDEARKLAERLRIDADLKEALERDERARLDEIERQERKRQQAEDRRRHTLRALLDVYAGYLEKQGKASARDVSVIFRRHIYEAFPHLANTPAADVQARDVAAMTRALIEAGKERTAGKLRSYVAAAYALALRAETDASAPADALEFKVPANPAQATKPYSGVKSRDRVLTEVELRCYMRRVTSVDSDVQRDVLMLLLLLGGQRPAQLLRARVGDVDLMAGTILLRDPKGKRAEPRLHKLPLQGAALEIVKRRIAAAEAQRKKQQEEQSKKLQEQSVDADDAPVGNLLLFSTHGNAAVRLETLSARVSEIARRMVKTSESRSSFQLRDLRRTAETMLASMKVGKDTRARLLSHGISGVQDKHYDFHSYAPEMTAALESWERRLSRIADSAPQSDNVVLLSRTA